MGTHGRGAVMHALLGNVAERVVRTAPCPVLTVRQSRAAAQGAVAQALVKPTRWADAASYGEGADSSPRLREFSAT